MKIIIILSILSLSQIVLANKGAVTGLDIPRYVSLKSNDSNIRVGPSINYPIFIKYIFKDFPLKIIEEYGDWRKVVDFQNNSGWIHKSLIKNQRTAIIISQNKKKVDVYNISNGKIIGEIENGMIVNIPKCKLDWCLIIKNENKGWINKGFLWGTKENEEYNVGAIQKLTDVYLRSINLIEKKFFQK
tara:strand:- start:1257 stop:1817 length:561 start_codon:yes stop_codon:yes gene_type:complete